MFLVIPVTIGVVRLVGGNTCDHWVVWLVGGNTCDHWGGMVSSCWYVVLVWSLGGNMCDLWGLFGQLVVIFVISSVSMVVN